MNFNQVLTLTTSVALLGAPVSAFWRMECRGVSGQARLDPLVSYGSIAGHVHEIFGSSSFDDTSDYDSLIQGNCTSCAVTADKSAYWTPAAYFQDKTTGKFETVTNVGGMLAYYFLNHNPTGNQTIQAFPPGFRMIAGTSTRRNYTVGDGNYEQPDPPKSEWSLLGQTSQVDLAQRAVGFNCLDYSKAAEGSLYRHFLPSKDYIEANCPDGIRAELMFPSCWNGVDLDSHDHKSHVAYPDLVMTGNCPEDFPVRLPGLFYETIWNFTGYPDRSGIFVFSNGDPLGFGYHGDFIMGWDQTNFTLQDAVDTCTDPSGEISACPLFSIVSEEVQGECKIDLPGALVKEKVSGPLAKLPGTNPIAWGPEPATGANPQTPSSIVMPTLTYSAGSTPSVTGSYVPGNAFGATGTGPSSISSASTITAAPPSGTEYAITSLYSSTMSGGMVVVSELIIEEEIVYVTDTVTTTTVYVTPTAAEPSTAAEPTAAEPSAAARLRRDAHVHAHQHRHVHGRAH